MAIGFYEFLVGEEDDNLSLRHFLRRRCGLSARSMTVIKYGGGSITCGTRELRAHDILRRGEMISVRLPRESCEIEPVKGDLDILYEDERLLIVNKPSAMPVHPTKRHQLDTLANIVSFYQKSRGESYTFRALNRLDKDTSGCVVMVKDRIAYALIQPTVDKRYIAVCEGYTARNGVIDAPIALAPDSKIKRCVSPDGAEAVTHYEALAQGNGHTMLRLRLETGRTHQIRCHMSHIGHPLAGDDLYGGSLRFLDRQALHCRDVELIHPDTREKLSLTTEIPAIFHAIISP